MGTTVCSRVLGEGPGDLVAKGEKDLSYSSMQDIVHQVNLPSINKKLLCLRLLCQSTGQNCHNEQTKLHNVQLKDSAVPLVRQPILEWIRERGAEGYIQGNTIIISAQPGIRVTADVRTQQT